MEKINKFTSKIYRIYYYLFKDRFSKKLNLKFDNIKRWDLIDYLNTTYKFNSYLEIGCDDDQLFSKISIKEKIGVDPVSGGNYRAKSEDFFDKNLKKFDLVFIDGLHEYHQVKKDILNSIKFLNKEGFILVHDCLPRSISAQAVPRFRNIWNGDVWKAIVELRTYPNLEIFTCLADEGISIIQVKKNSQILKIEKNIADLKFKDYYYNYRDYMRVINFSEIKKKYI
ncbi:MAG: class I SAM-dependent methyltransferase [Candidatus Pelagibacter bacterium]|nr:class I SAM-dependent methyltransferase [Candidatus Pelagibacter bacterium]